MGKIGERRYKCICGEILDTKVMHETLSFMEATDKIIEHIDHGGLEEIPSSDNQGNEIQIDITKCAICDRSPVFDEPCDWAYVGKTKVYYHKVCGRQLIGNFLNDKFKNDKGELNE